MEENNSKGQGSPDPHRTEVARPWSWTAILGPIKLNRVKLWYSSTRVKYIPEKSKKWSIRTLLRLLKRGLESGNQFGVVAAVVVMA